MITPMKTQPIEIDLKTLMREIHLYLAAVDAFRAAGYPPRPRTA